MKIEDQFTLKTFYGKTHILTDLKREGGGSPNFMGTGKALAGIMKKGETIRGYFKRMKGVKQSD